MLLVIGYKVVVSGVSFALPSPLVKGGGSPSSSSSLIVLASGHACDG